MSLSIKDSVRLTGISPQMAIAAIVAEGVYSDQGYNCCVTSAVDSRHRVGSDHYRGDALDLRTRDVPPSDRVAIAGALSDRLGPDYFVLLESDHIHVAWKPAGHLTD